MALTGHLSDLSLSELIEFFCNQRKTGQLKVLYPQGYGHFYLQSGSVVDARIGVLRGIEAVYYALTLPNAKFEFGGSSEPVERTINQPWTQVVLEGLRRLDEGVVPPEAFPPEYDESVDASTLKPEGESLTGYESSRVPGFLTHKEPTSNRRFLIGGAVTVVALMSVAVIGVPAGWYGRADTTANVISPVIQETVSEQATEVADVPEESDQSAEKQHEAALAAKRQRDKERVRAVREEVARESQPAPTLSGPAPAKPTSVVADPAKPAPRKVIVTVTFDESGRVIQASGADATAVRIARQKRFPAGKAGSTTITIPIN